MNLVSIGKWLKMYWGKDISKSGNFADDISNDILFNKMVEIPIKF